MKVILIPLLISLITFSCQPESSKKEDAALLQNNYSEIRDGLFKDDEGNIYFKALDGSDPNKIVDRFIYAVYSEEFHIEGYKEMKDVLDLKSFKSLGNNYFQDKNHIYYFYAMADGGTMTVVVGADSQSFKVFDHSLYGIDKKSAFYRGTKIKGVDVQTFQPIIIEDSGNKIGWYARDKNSYYYGHDVMSEVEEKELTEEITQLKAKIIGL